MFTWNFQYMSKARLADTLNQLMLNSGPGDILVRIHTSIHQPDEAVELARFIKKQVPRAQIFGTTTSAVINWGRIVQNQCIISISQMGDVFDIKTVKKIISMVKYLKFYKINLCNDINKNTECLKNFIREYKNG